MSIRRGPIIRPSRGWFHYPPGYPQLALWAAFFRLFAAAAAADRESISAAHSGPRFRAAGRDAFTAWDCPLDNPTSLSMTGKSRVRWGSDYLSDVGRARGPLLSFAPAGLVPLKTDYPGLTPWAAFFRRFAAGRLRHDRKSKSPP